VGEEISVDNKSDCVGPLIDQLVLHVHYVVRWQSIRCANCNVAPSVWVVAIGDGTSCTPRMATAISGGMVIKMSITSSIGTSVFEITLLDGTVSCQYIQRGCHPSTIASISARIAGHDDLCAFFKSFANIVFGDRFHVGLNGFSASARHNSRHGCESPARSTRSLVQNDILVAC